MDPMQWIDAVRMRVQTADKNITVIHTTPDYQLMSCEVKTCMFEINKWAEGEIILDGLRMSKLSENVNV